jgi:hypothetical protein
MSTKLNQGDKFLFYSDTGINQRTNIRRFLYPTTMSQISNERLSCTLFILHNAARHWDYGTLATQELGSRYQPFLNWQVTKLLRLMVDG